MENFNKINIQDMPKKDLYTIINALDLAAKDTSDFKYLELKEEIIEQLCALAECDEEDFILFLQS